MASGESEENEAVRAYFPSFAAHSSACQTNWRRGWLSHSASRKLEMANKRSHDTKPTQ